MTVQGPVKEQQRDGMSHKGGGSGRGAHAATTPPPPPPPGNGKGWPVRVHSVARAVRDRGASLRTGSLREQLIYPDMTPDRHRSKDLVAILKDVGLGYLSTRFGLDVVMNWDDLLSGGEQQRLGFARCARAAAAMRVRRGGRWGRGRRLLRLLGSPPRWGFLEIFPKFSNKIEKN